MRLPLRPPYQSTSRHISPPPTYVHLHPPYPTPSQGPPGTGKTFIGLMVVRTLLRNTALWSAQGMAATDAAQAAAAAAAAAATSSPAVSCSALSSPGGIGAGSAPPGGIGAVDRRMKAALDAAERMKRRAAEKTAAAGGGEYRRGAGGNGGGGYRGGAGGSPEGKRPMEAGMGGEEKELPPAKAARREGGEGQTGEIPEGEGMLGEIPGGGRLPPVSLQGEQDAPARH
jgi:hypothetical protein